MSSIEIGKKYRNVHTGYICRVRKKIFFNIQYVYEGDPELYYCHYKRFRKNWIEIHDENEED